MGRGVSIGARVLKAFVVPTDSPEPDGTIDWDSTLVLLHECLCAARAIAEPTARLVKDRCDGMCAAS